MTVSIAHLGPPGTYTEQAALAYVNWLDREKQPAVLRSYSSIAQTLQAVSQGQAEIGVVPVENSIEGSVAITLDTLWHLDALQIYLALILPISHALLSCAPTLDTIHTVYSHPHALGQCQMWLERFLPTVQLIPTHSTTEALQQLEHDVTVGAIASQRAAQLYGLPILASAINDYPENFTRFWVVGQGQPPSHLRPSVSSSHTTLAFSMRNAPGTLAKQLQVFAQRGINLSRVESRPTKRFLGDYLLFIDLEADVNSSVAKSALAELMTHTEVLKVFGSYSVLPIPV